MAHSDPSLALQATIRERLLASPELLALVPPDNILDTNGRPERVPCINIGEGQTVYQRFYCTTYATLHVWFQEPGLVQAKMAASLIIDALSTDAQIDGEVLELDGFVCEELSVNQTRFLRDPHGSYSHGIITLAGIMKATN
jgi:hypothetical protein